MRHRKGKKGFRSGSPPGGQPEHLEARVLKQNPSWPQDGFIIDTIRVGDLGVSINTDTGKVEIHPPGGVKGAKTKSAGGLPVAFGIGKDVVVRTRGDPPSSSLAGKNVVRVGDSSASLTKSVRLKGNFRFVLPPTPPRPRGPAAPGGKVDAK